MKEILSLGAGVQSSTLLLMSCAGELPTLDAAIFADTEWEPPKVYRWLDYLKNKATIAGIPILVRRAGNLKDDLLEFWHQRKSGDGKRHASIPAFIKNPDGTRGIVRRQCTGTYKIDVVEKTVREEILGLKRGQRWPVTSVIRQWIGISTDEVQRMRRSIRPAIEFWYPLVKELKSPVKTGLFSTGYSRIDCLDWMKRNGHPEPPRSACIGCPFHSDTEWFIMKHNDPESFEDACKVDDLIREKDQARIAENRPGELIGSPYLHSSLIPLRMVQFNPGKDLSEGRGMVNECSGMCGV